MFFKICLMLFVIYSFVSQLILLFDHSFHFGSRTLEEYPYAVEVELERLKNWTENSNSSLGLSF